MMLKTRYMNGLEKLAFASSQVAIMQKELTDLQPELIRTSAVTENLMVKIEQDTVEVENKKEVCHDRRVSPSLFVTVVVCHRHCISPSLCVTVIVCHRCSVSSLYVTTICVTLILCHRCYFSPSLHVIIFVCHHHYVTHHCMSLFWCITVIMCHRH